MANKVLINDNSVYLNDDGSVMLQDESSTDGITKVKVNGEYIDIIDKTASLTIPTKTSDITNDSGYLTQHQSLAECATKDELQIVQDIANGKNTAYGIQLNGSNISQEDSEKYDLTQEDLNASIAAGSLNGAFNSQADIVYCDAFITYDTQKIIESSTLKIGDVVWIKDTDIPDRWYLGHSDNGYAFAKMETVKFVAPDLKLVSDRGGNAVSGLTVSGHTIYVSKGTYLTEHQSLAACAKTADLGELAYKNSLTASDVGALPDTTSIPTKVSDLTNDSGFISEETDPTVPSWAKEPTKPTYTASEVGALPNTTVIPSKTSDLTNDTGFISTEVDPTVPSWAKQENKPSYTASEVGALPDTTTIPSKTSELENDAGFITLAEGQTPISSEEVEQKIKDIIGSAPETLDTLKELADALGDDPNFATTITNELAKKEDKSNLKALAYKDSLTASEVGALPDTTVIPTKVSELTNDSGYISTETDPTVPSWAKQTNKPTYTAAEVGALPDTTTIPSKTSQLENDSNFVKAQFVLTGTTLNITLL